MGHGELQPGNTGAHEEVEVVEGAGANADEHLVRLDDWLGCVLVNEDFGPAMLMNADSFMQETGQLARGQRTARKFGCTR